MVGTQAKRKIDGRTFTIITGHGNKQTAQEYAEKRRKKDCVRVLPVNINGKKVHGIWLSRGRKRK